MNTAALLHNTAKTFSNRPAITVGDERKLTYAQLQGRVVRLAAGLLKPLGLKSGDRVAVVMSNCPQYLEVLFAIWHAGLIAVPVNAKLHPKELAYILENSQTAACMVTDDLANAVAAAAADVTSVKRIVCVDRPEYESLMSQAAAQASVSGGDVAWLFYTSGTTGRPKGATLTHLNLQLMAWSYLCDIDFLTERDSLLHLGPQSHAAGFLALSHVAKGSQHVLPASGGFDPSEIISVVNRQDSLTFFAAPTMLRRLLDCPALEDCRVEHIRSILGGAAPFYAQDVRRVLAAFGPRFINAYGQGECPCTIAAMPKHLYAADADDERLVSVGIPRTGAEIRVVDTEDEEVATGEVGEIVVRSDIVMRGYWENPDATAQALVGGWLHTGDLGAMDSQGFLSLKGRCKDLIISGGANIYPREVEDVLLLDPEVAEAAVVGQADVEWGEVAVAFIVPRAGQKPVIERLEALCLQNLARYKRPRHYVFVESLPRNSTGKVLKTELRVQLGVTPSRVSDRR
jgi:acyl-CoA synthetase (AMP-forming)/AMP-acid ligase II